MKYLLSVDPEKDERVLQLLESLQELGVILSFSLAEASQEHSGASESVAALFPSGQLTYDLAEQYRDLVD